MKPPSIVEDALKYHSRGYWVTPTSGKAPVLDDWPNLHLDEEEIRHQFRAGHGVGVVLAPSGLIDLDFDDAVAIKAYRILVPPELGGVAVFKHADRPHVVVKANGVPTRRYKRSNGTTLLELRSEGAQTVFPPSIHPDGLAYIWVNDCEPPEVDAARLQILAAIIATASYASEFWSPGSRHDLALALAGFLARRLSESDVCSVVRTTATIAADEEVADRELAVQTTLHRLQSGEPVVGLPTLEGLAPDLARALASWWAPWPEERMARAASVVIKRSQADLLVDIGRKAQLFHDPSGTAFARFRVEDHQETWPLQSKRFKNWLRREFHREHEKAPNGEAVTSACGVLDGIACFDGPEHELHNRVAWHDGAIYYDLADGDWRTVRIDGAGWQIVADPPILFRRYAHQRAQVAPAHGGDVRDVFRFLNVRTQDQLLLLIWLITAFVPDIPHPMPDFHGPKGSGKTAGQRVLRRLIDPSGIESLAFPGDVRELVQQLSHHYAPIYDNVDSLSPWISDLLCRAVTGEGFSKRELYTDDDDIIYSYRRVVMLNGINVVSRRSDLLDRTILIVLERISRESRLAEREFWKDFEAARPSLLGSVFDALSRTLAVYDRVEAPPLERMADFTRWGAAVSEAIGEGVDAFVCAYSSNIGVQTQEAVEGHIVGATLLALMEDRDEWSGTPTELLAALEEAGVKARLFRRLVNGKVDAKSWPGAPHILTRRLNEVRSDLADLGLEIETQLGDRRLVTIRRPAPQDAQDSVGSVSSDGSNPNDAGSADANDAADATFAPSGEEQWEQVIT